MKCNSSKFDGFEMRKCNNPAKKDGLCMVHHPESVKRREAREAEKCAARKENSIFTKYDRVVQQRDELLAALKDMVDYFQYTDESDGQYECVQRAKAAIAKVE